MAYAAAAGFTAAFVWICFLQNSPSPRAFSAFAEHSVFSQRTRSCFVSVSSRGCPVCGHESLDITAPSLLWSLLQSCPSVCGRIRTNSSYFESWPPTCLWLHPTNHQRFALWSPLSPGWAASHIHSCTFLTGCVTLPRHLRPSPPHFSLNFAFKVQPRHPG